MAELLARLWRLHLLVLEGTGAAARLAAWPIPVPPEDHLLAVTVAGASLLLLLYAALASGPDPRVRAFRGGTLVAGLALPLGAIQVSAAARELFGGGLLLLVLLAGLLHAALAARRRAGTAARALEAARLAAESAGLALFLWGGIRMALGEPVSLRLAFWALFLLRLSVADLLRPATLVFESGLAESAVTDLKHAAGATRRKRRSSAATRLSRGAAGAAKGLLVLLWLVLPFLAAAAPTMVRRGLWPHAALALGAYPPIALGATAALLLLRSARLLPRSPLRGARGGIVALASLLYLWHAYRDPAFAAYRAHLPGIVLSEALAGFLLGAAARGSAGSRREAARIRMEGKE